MFSRNRPWRGLRLRTCVPCSAKRFVYIIRSVHHPGRRYVGDTAEMPAPLDANNAGQNGPGATCRPWVLDVCVEFRTERGAMRFEPFLKPGAGPAFASRHFVSR